MHKLSQTNPHKPYKLAVWAVTPNGAKLAGKIAADLPDIDIYLSSTLEEIDIPSTSFQKLSESISSQFNQYRGHIFIMATGIVIRSIAAHIRNKTIDPAVVVVDEIGRYAISLLSGHMGGANLLAKEIAACIGAEPVITTATDVNNLPAIDVLAEEEGLFIENPDAIKNVNMAFLTGKKVTYHDPFNLICQRLPKSTLFDPGSFKAAIFKGGKQQEDVDSPGIYVDDKVVKLPQQILILRPRTLVAGIGCNRNTSVEELKTFLNSVLKGFRFSSDSLSCLATINIKADEYGILDLAKALDLPIEFFDKDELNHAEGIETPSIMVESHVGVKSVCEAAAILAANQGALIVPKQATRNVTVAIARKSFIS